MLNTMFVCGYSYFRCNCTFSTFSNKLLYTVDIDSHLFHSSSVLSDISNYLTVLWSDLGRISGTVLFLCFVLGK